MNKVDNFLKLFNAFVLGHFLTAIHYRFFHPSDWVWLTLVCMVNALNLLIIITDDD